MICITVEGKERYILELLSEIAGLPSGDWLTVEVRGGDGAIRWEGGRLVVGSELIASVWRALMGLGDPKRPLVDAYARRFGEGVRQALEHNGLPYISLGKWPEGRPFALFPSHDVDQVHRRDLVVLARDLYRMGRDVLRGRFRSVASTVEEWTCRTDSYWNFEKWRRLEERLGVRSTFFFMEGPRWSRYGRRYNTWKLRSVLKELVEGGWEVGLHGSYYAFRDARRLWKEREALEDIIEVRVRGNRQHYLRLDPGRSFRCYEEAGFLYDATLGYNNQVGYRAGISFPFRPYDPERGKAMDLVELPLGIQDVAVEREGVSEEDILRLAERVREDGGMLSLLWHQSAFHRSPLYEAILRWAEGCGAWIATGREIASWWRNRGRVKVRARWTPSHLRIWLSGAPRRLVLSVSLPGGKEEFLPALPGRYRMEGGIVDIEEWKDV